MILHLPVRRKTILLNGEQTSVLEVANGFVSVTTDAPPVGAESGRLLISNPLTEVMQDLFNRGFVSSTERCQIALEEISHSNPGVDDEPSSITHLDQIV